MKVTQLYIHPVKSLGGFPVQSYSIDRFGPQWDRRWMVVDEQGRFLTQRQLPKMALINTRVDEDQITLTAANGSAMQFNAQHFAQGDVIPVTVWHDQCLAQRGSEGINRWLSDALGVACQLVFMPERTRRRVDTDYAENGETVSFADGFPLLLTTEASLQDLNRQMQIDIGMNRFRPNLVLDGVEPWQEDGWSQLKIGAVEFTVAKPCSRCAIPTIDPQTGLRQPQVFRTLKQLRQRNGEVYFGQNLLVTRPGRVSVGDTVEVV